MKPALADGVSEVYERLQRMSPDSIRFSDFFLLELHREAFGHLVPFAGQIRKKDVVVGTHLPPSYPQNLMLLRQFAENLEFLVQQVKPDQMNLAQLVEIFSEAEGRFTNIHPFEDFNGRVSRMLSWALLCRLGLPFETEIVPTENDEPGKQRLLAALRSYDAGDRAPLQALWEERLARALKVE